jgi:hypothetical protein
MYRESCRKPYDIHFFRLCICFHVQKNLFFVDELEPLELMHDFVKSKQIEKKKERILFIDSIVQIG